MNPFVLLLDQAPPHVQAAVAARADSRVRARLLRGWQAPGATLCSHVLRHGTPELRAELAANTDAPPEVLHALAADADTRTAARLFRNGAAPRETRLAVLPQVPEEELLAHGDLKEIQERWSLQQRIAVLVESPDPQRVSAALALFDPEMNRVSMSLVLLRAYLGLMRAGGPRLVEEHLRDAPAHDDAEIRHALTRPFRESRLAAAVERLGSTRALLALRHVERHQMPTEMWLAAPRAALEWDLLVAAHRETPFATPVMRALSRQLGCPAALYADPRPLPTPGLRAATSWTGLPAGTEPLPRDMWMLTAFAFNRRLMDMHAAGTIRADLLVRHAAPAYRTLMLFGGATGAALADARDAITRVARERVGADVEAWTVALALLEGFHGSVAELFDVAAGVVRDVVR